MFRRLLHHHLRIVFLCGGIVLLMIAFISLFEVASASSTLPTTHTALSATGLPQDTQSSCLQAMPYNQSNLPSLNFCSPIFSGNIEGPFGSHITLIGENFPASPTAILLIPKSAVPDQQTITATLIQSCLSNKLKDCFPIPNIPADLSAKTFFVPFTWNFLVTEKLPADFFAVALLGNPPKSQFVQSPALTTFTLLTYQAPCIIVEQQLTTCASAQSLSLTPGSKITLQGRNWRPEKLHIQVTITCSGLTQPPPISSVVDSDAKGMFTLPVNLPQNINGSCTIQASNQVNTVANPGSTGNTIASGALSFGNTDDIYQLTLTLQPLPPPPGPTVTPRPRPTQTPVPPPSPAPSNISFFNFSNILAILAILPAVYALLRFAQLRKQPTPERSSTSNRKSDANQSSRDKDLIAGQGTIILGKEGKPQSTYLLTAIMPDMSGRLPNPASQAVQEKEIQEAIYALSRGFPAMAVQLAERALQNDPNALNNLLLALSKSETDSTSSPTQEEMFKDRKLVYDDRKNVFKYCSKILISSRLLLKSSTSESDADIYFNYAYAYSSLPGISPEIDNIYLNKALDSSQKALTTYQHRKYAPAVAATQHNLGNVYFRLGHLTASVTPVKNAIAYYEQASAYYKSTDPLTWAKVQTQIGNSYYELWQESNQDSDLQLAIQRYKDTLSVYNSSQYALNQARTYYNLAKVSYAAYIPGTGNVAELNSINNYLKQAESVYRQLNNRIMLANTLYRRGLISFEFAKIQQSEKNRHKYLNRAIQYYNETLQLAQDSSLRAGCFKNRGLAFELLSENRNLEILKTAIKDYLEVLHIFNSASYKSLDDSIELYEHLAKAHDVASTLSKNQRHDYLTEATKYYQILRDLYKEKQSRNPQTRQRITEIEKRLTY